MLPLMSALLCGAVGEKIFWVPFPGSVSHHMLAAKVGRELASRGHEFIVVNSDLSFRPGYTAGIDHTNITSLKYANPRTEDEWNVWIEETAEADPFTGTQKLTEMVSDGCDALLGDKALLDKIRDADVIVVDAAIFCGSLIRDYLKIKTRIDFLPVTFMDPFYTPRLGASNSYANTPQMGSKLTADMDFGQRVQNTIVAGVLELLMYTVTDPLADKLRSKYGVEGSHADAQADTGLMITQTTWATEYPRAVPPAVTSVGPILPEPAAELPAEYAALADGATQGLVVVSFGSQARVDQELVDKMAAAFVTLPQQFVWKLPEGITALTTPAKNIKVVRWFPQNDLLGHRNTKAFVSHGGLNGCNEAAFHGVPVIGFPLFGDQWDNIMRLEYQGMAVLVDSKTFTAESLASDVAAVVGDSNGKFQKAADKVSGIIRDPIHGKRPVEMAADWIEYGIRHDGARFQMVPGLKHPWYVKNGLDVSAFFVVVLYGLSKLVMGVCRMLCCPSSKQKAAKTEKTA